MTHSAVGGALLLGLLFVATPASAQIYKCVDEDGHTTYSNVTSAKNCKRLQLDPVSTMPATPSSRGPRTVTASPSPTDFPKVSGDAQKARDNDRRAILEQELSTEKQSLEAAKKELAAQEAVRTGDERNFQKVQDRLQPYRDKVAVHERNIQALTKEMGNLK